MAPLDRGPRYFSCEVVPSYARMRVRRRPQGTVQLRGIVSCVRPVLLSGTRGVQANCQLRQPSLDRRPSDDPTSAHCFTGSREATVKPAWHHRSRSSLGLTWPSVSFWIESSSKCDQFQSLICITFRHDGTGGKTRERKAVGAWSPLRSLLGCQAFGERARATEEIQRALMLAPLGEGFHAPRVEGLLLQPG